MPPILFAVCSQHGFKMNENQGWIMRIIIPQNIPQSHYSEIFWWASWKGWAKKKTNSLQTVSYTHSCLLWHSSPLPSCSQPYIDIFSSFPLDTKVLFPFILILEIGMERAWYTDLQKAAQIVPTQTRNKIVLSSASSPSAVSSRSLFLPQ